MSRFRPIPPSEQTPEQEVLHKEMDIGTQKEYGSTFTLKNSEGALLGPFAPLLYKHPSIMSYSSILTYLVQLHSYSGERMAASEPAHYEPAHNFNA